jgi:hypothetical protein
MASDRSNGAQIRFEPANPKGIKSPGREKRATGNTDQKEKTNGLGLGECAAGAPPLGFCAASPG